MNVYQFAAKHGRQELYAVGEKCGISIAYMSHLINGHKRCSVERAKALEAASDGRIKAADMLLNPNDRSLPIDVPAPTRKRKLSGGQDARP